PRARVIAISLDDVATRAVQRFSWIGNGRLGPATGAWRPNSFRGSAHYWNCFRALPRCTALEFSLSLRIDSRPHSRERGERRSEGGHVVRREWSGIDRGRAGRSERAAARHASTL